jgi:hypothetical protein
VRNLSVHTAITLLIAATQACASGTGLPPVFGQFRRASECEGPRPVSRIAISGGSTTETGTNRVRLIANTLIDLKQLPSPAAYGHVLVTVTSVDGHAWSDISDSTGRAELTVAAGKYRVVASAMSLESVSTDWNAVPARADTVHATLAMKFSCLPI